MAKRTQQTITAKDPDQSAFVTVEIPAGVSQTNGYASQVRIHDQLHLSNMTVRERKALAALRSALYDSYVEIGPFKRVQHQNEAVRWLLNLIADAYGIEK